MFGLYCFALYFCAIKLIKRTKTMTQEQFFNLPTNKKTVEILFAESRKLFRSDKREDIAKNWFFNEVASTIRTYIYLPKALKEVTVAPTTKSVYEDLVKIKSYGYRKELVLPF